MAKQCRAAKMIFTLGFPDVTVPKNMAITEQYFLQWVSV